MGGGILATPAMVTTMRIFKATVDQITTTSINASETQRLHQPTENTLQRYTTHPKLTYASQNTPRDKHTGRPPQLHGTNSNHTSPPDQSDH
jgi:hypothetical protein